MAASNPSRPEASLPNGAVQTSGNVAASNLSRPPEASLLKGTARTSEIVGVTSFARESVIRLRESNFSLGSKERIALTYNNCILVLFYTENEESKHIAGIWAQAASQISSPTFAACNLIDEKQVAEAFTSLNMDRNHPLYWARMKQAPFIIVYRAGWPQAFFNGQRTVETFLDYAMNLACEAAYHEEKQDFSSVQADNRYEMSMPHQGVQRTSSTDFKSTEPLRGYNPNIVPVIKGSSEEAQEIAALQQARASSAALAARAANAALPSAPPAQPAQVRVVLPSQPTGGIPIGGGTSAAPIQT